MVTFVPAAEGCLETFGEMVIHVIPAEFFLEFRQFRVIVNQQKFDARHVSVIFQIRRRDGRAEAAMMGAASLNRGRRRNF